MSTSMTTYEYTGVDRLNEPHKYMYTEYLGIGFMQLYFDDRKKSIEKNRVRDCKQSISEINSYLCTASIKKLKQQESTPIELRGKVERLESFGIESEVFTRGLLLSLLFNQLNTQNTDLVKNWLDQLIQRFEVTKKIYETYPSGFRTGKGSGQDVSLYWLFSLLLSLYYAEGKNIKHLNTLLKVNDLLCSLDDKAIKEIPKEGLELVLSIEMNSIKELTKCINGGDFVFE